MLYTIHIFNSRNVIKTVTPTTAVEVATAVMPATSEMLATAGTTVLAGKHYQ
jgi:hypothetical protein